MLHALAVVTFQMAGDAALHRAVTPLHPSVQSLLHGLGLAADVRAILRDAARIRIQV